MGFNGDTPHSLGKSVEWKPEEAVPVHRPTPSPHSLGKSVEWKLTFFILAAVGLTRQLPTRWGNQLNGNLVASFPVAYWIILPTRWGNQLNGNLK